MRPQHGRARLLPLAITAIGALIAAGGYAYWRYSSPESNAGYVTDTIDRGSIVSTVTATGTVNPVSTVQVGTYVSGPIRAIDVDYNSPVRKGQRVANIDPAPFQVKVDQAQANLARTRLAIKQGRGR